MNPENQPKAEPEDESEKASGPEAKKSKTEEGNEDEPPPLTPNTELKSEDKEDIKMETEEKTEEPKKKTEDDDEDVPKKVRQMPPRNVTKNFYFSQKRKILCSTLPMVVLRNFIHFGQLKKMLL